MNNQNPVGRLIPCVRCGKQTHFSPRNPYRPFCSERCKMVDLGNWADGRYAIPVADPLPDQMQENNTESDDDSAENGDQAQNQGSEE